VFKSNGLIRDEKKEQIRQELKQHIKEGVVVLDCMFDLPTLINLPSECEYEVMVENVNMEGEDDSREN
jgi:hypothetical protein